MFTPKYQDGSEELTALLSAAAELAKISTVRNFEVLRQVSPKCEHKFGLSMEFENDDSYQFYNEHPKHVDFLNNYWIPGVQSWQEIDYIPY